MVNPNGCLIHLSSGLYKFIVLVMGSLLSVHESTIVVRSFEIATPRRFAIACYLVICAIVIGFKYLVSVGTLKLKVGGLS